MNTCFRGPSLRWQGARLTAKYILYSLVSSIQGLLYTGRALGSLPNIFEFKTRFTIQYNTMCCLIVFIVPYPMPTYFMDPKIALGKHIGAKFHSVLDVSGVDPLFFSGGKLYVYTRQECWICLRYKTHALGITLGRSYRGCFIQSIGCDLSALLSLHTQPLTTT